MGVSCSIQTLMGLTIELHILKGGDGSACALLHGAGIAGE